MISTVRIDGVWRNVPLGYLTLEMEYCMREEQAFFDANVTDSNYEALRQSVKDKRSEFYHDTSLWKHLS